MLTGSITTDNSIGNLTQVNIVDWSLELSNGPGGATFLDPSNSTYTLSGDALSATSTALFWDYSAGGTLLFATNGTNTFGPCPAGFGCFVLWGNEFSLLQSFGFASCGRSQPCDVPDLGSSPDRSAQSSSAIATVVTPLPATFSIYLLGVGLIGLFRLSVPASGPPTRRPADKVDGAGILRRRSLRDVF